ncbi:MAG: hypothetical protein WGN25_04505 [Candidatus Electrothrix sp. GW3-4]|uniref:hypothetical protein n=1 Tax=Candidatus Electrothrix sp. GW3-4 TaxID=3126740 RepID=UPI0030D2EBC9
MKKAYRQTAHRVFIALALFFALGCTPARALSDCEHDHAQHEETVVLPDFGFSLNGACNELSPEAASDDTETEDELLKDIEEPLEAPSSDLAATLEENQPTS